MIHPSAIVEIKIDPKTNVWAFAHVLAGAVVGKCVNVGDHCFIEGGATIGDNCTIKNQVCIWKGVTIEDDVFVGPSVTFTNDKHPRSPRMSAVKARYACPSRWLSETVVRRGCTIGAGATICPGIELGRFAMVAAGAVVTRSVPPYALVAGNPATSIGWVCSCGQKLADRFDAATCVHCGETPADRQCGSPIAMV